MLKFQKSKHGITYFILIKSSFQVCHGMRISLWKLNVNHEFISGEEVLARLDDVPIKYKWINENGVSKKLEVQDSLAICDKFKVLQSICCQTPEDVS